MLQARTFLNYKVEMGVPLHIVSRGFLCFYLKIQLCLFAQKMFLLFFKFSWVYLLLEKFNG
jgi:hypothetical protein